MGQALRDGYRQRVFLMTKIDGRTRPPRREQIDESLQRLQTDLIDLLQFHEVIRLTDPDRVFAPGGAMEALVAARKAGQDSLHRLHRTQGPAIHLHMLEVAARARVHFDTVQMPVNAMDAHFQSFQRTWSRR